MASRTLKDKVAVIAGGGKNLGALIAQQFAAAGVRGAAIHYNSTSSKPEADKTVAILKAEGVDASPFKAIFLLQKIMRNFLMRH